MDELDKIEFCPVKIQNFLDKMDKLDKIQKRIAKT